MPEQPLARRRVRPNKGSSVPRDSFGSLSLGIIKALVLIPVVGGAAAGAGLSVLLGLAKSQRYWTNHAVWLATLSASALLVWFIAIVSTAKGDRFLLMPVVLWRIVFPILFVASAVGGFFLV